MRCASIHRKLGTHISKVKSLSMYSWSNEQVDVSFIPPPPPPGGLVSLHMCRSPWRLTRLVVGQNMRKVGNVLSNQIYNPDNKKPQIPIDADEADSAMERFIRQKYTHSVARDAAKSRSPRSDEGTPPPLPPKNSTKFGFRSASSIFPLSSRAKKEARAAALVEAAQTQSPGHTASNKPSKVFGATVDYESPDEDKKLAKLRDMGFQDSQRNSIVLRGVNGSLDRAVEALVRLGEGGRQPTARAAAAPPRDKTLRTPRSLTPLTASPTGAAMGLTVPQKAAQDRPTTASTTTTSTSTNPFDVMTSAPPQTAHSTGTLHDKNPYGGIVAASTNPFDQSWQAADAVGQAFWGLAVSAPQQSLFPHRTGEVASQATQQLRQPALQQYMSPSAPSSPCNYQHMSFGGSMTYPQPAPLPQEPKQTGYNPFLSQPSSPTRSGAASASQHGMAVGTGHMLGGFANNPFARSPTRIASPTLGQIPEQAQTMFVSASPQPLAPNTNPFFADAPPAPPMPQAGQAPLGPQLYGQQAYGGGAHGQQAAWQQAQPAQRRDKASILALYNQPYQAPPQPATQEAGLPAQPAPTAAEHHAVLAETPSAQTGLGARQPAGGRTNPFMSSGGAPAAAAAAADGLASSRHVTRESMNLGMDMAWTNGRYSPDAFASLSARHV